MLHSDFTLQVKRGGFLPLDTEFYYNGNKAGSERTKEYPGFSPKAVVVGMNLIYGGYSIITRCIIMIATLN
jgi:hypothetical protein